MAFTHNNKVDTESFIKARIRIWIRSQTSGSGSDQKGPDPTGSGSATLVISRKLSFWAHSGLGMVVIGAIGVPNFVPALGY
jgi:hypothetical protein